MGGIGGLYFSSIAAYADRYGIKDVDQFDRFHTYLKAMDGVFLEIKNNPKGINYEEEIDGEDSDYVKMLLCPEKYQRVVRLGSEDTDETDGYN